MTRSELRRARAAIAFVVTTIVSAGPAFGQAQDAPLSCLAQGPTYYPRGDHWQADPDGAGPVFEYRISNQPVDGLALANSQAAIESAMDTWMAVRCAGFDCADVACDPGGPIPNLRMQRGPDYPGRDGGDNFAGAVSDWDLNNVIYFVKSNTVNGDGDSGWEDHPADIDDNGTIIKQFWDENTLAVTSNVFALGSYYLVHADMAFNDEFFDWRAGGAGCTLPNADCFDVERVALHEFGHFIGFNHVNCAGAIMFPSGTSTDATHTLTDNETAGICALYPPRPLQIACGTPSAVSASCHAFGEQCDVDADCASPPTTDVDAWCIEDTDFFEFKKCTYSCDNTGQCPTAHICVTRTAGTFCLPGPNFAVSGGGCSCDDSGGCDNVPAGSCDCDPDCFVGTGGGGGGGGPTGGSLDLCASCVNGDQCQSGVCVGDGTNGICVEACLPGSTTCGTGFTCEASSAGWAVCWPEAGNDNCNDPTLSGQQLNDVCYLENTVDSGDSYYDPCAPDLACFYFRPRCAGQVGACVSYCDNIGRDCAAGLTCCYSVDVQGNCIEVPDSVDPTIGGCFNLRGEGESCVIAENSVCHDDLQCEFYGADASTAKCYRSCPNASECDESSLCVEALDGCGDAVRICCDGETWTQSQESVCVPPDVPARREVGMLCNDNDDCDSGLCLSYENTSACSRSCRLGAAGTCPQHEDLNGDGTEDGAFVCVEVNGEGHCWPDGPPIERNVDCDEEPTAPECNSDVDPPTGCCSATGGQPQRSGDMLINLLPWLPVLWLRARSRRRRPLAPRPTV